MAREHYWWMRNGPAAILSTGSVSVGTDSVYYAASGLAEAGFAILFLHEAGGCGATWNGQLTGLAQTARCLVPDLPGHGKSVGFGFQTITEYRNAMIGFLDALAIHWPVVIAGACLGATIAVDLALHAPDRAAGLILTGLWDERRSLQEILERTARGEAPDEFVEDLFSPHVSPRIKGEQLKRWRASCPTVRHADLVAMTRYRLRESLQRLRCPVLLVAGDEDRRISPEAVAGLARATPRGRSVVLESAGSLAMLEQPERFNRLVAEFVEELCPGIPRLEAEVCAGGYRRFRRV